MATLWTVGGCVIVLAVVALLSAREPKMREPNERRFLDTTSLDRAHWLAFGVALMSFFWGLDGLFIAAVRAVPNATRPSYPVDWLVPAGIIGFIGFVLMLFPLLRRGWFRRRIVLDVRLGGDSAAGLSTGWASDYIEGLKMGACEIIIHLRAVLITNRSKHETANILFRLHVEPPASGDPQNDVFPSHVRERLHDIAKFATPGNITWPEWVDDCHTGPVIVPPESSVEIQLCFIQLDGIPIVGPSGWPGGAVPIVVQELISQDEQIVPLRLMAPAKRVRFVG